MPGRVDLVAVENRVDHRRDAVTDAYLEHDGVEQAVGNVGILGDADADVGIPPVRQVRRLDHRIAVEAHALFLHESGCQLGEWVEEGDKAGRAAAA